MEQIMLFENNEVKVRTDEGNVLINLVHTAKCCGLTRVKGKANTLVVRWDRIKEKLNTICSSAQSWVPQNNGIDSSTPQYIEEIKYILEEIENTDDRNSIYMSSWLSKRLAMECHSQKAMEYKNFLASLDEKREQGLLTPKMDMETLSSVVSSTVQNIIPSMVKEITEQFAPVVLKSKQNVDNMRQLMCDQSSIYDQDREEIKRLIGFKSANTKAMSLKLKEVLSDKFKENIKATSDIYKRYRNKVFSEFNVSKWEDIPVLKQSSVFAYIEECLFE
ncbi:MAG: hypothetical protein ACRC1T_04900 [Clostridium chrysemydis]|uniref:hypothetical protein n=1 Tax=Clostridium chrysemydis TaxID=2665504 RepID=UPI003F387668